MYTVAVIIGSLRKNSINKKLARALEKAGEGIVRFKVVDLADIPVYNQDLEAELPAPVRKMKEEIASCDGVLIVTPEYNRSIPGMLKNVLDWGSRPYGQNVWAQKPTAVAGCSGGSVGTAVCQSHLRSVLTFLGAYLTTQPEMYIVDKPGLIADDGAVSEPSTVKFMQGFLTGFVQWIDKVK